MCAKCLASKGRGEFGPLLLGLRIGLRRFDCFRVWNELRFQIEEVAASQLLFVWLFHISKGPQRSRDSSLLESLNFILKPNDGSAGGVVVPSPWEIYPL